MIEWITQDELVEYPSAIEIMENHVNSMISAQEGERIWLLEHPPLYTGGTSAEEQDLLDNRFPVYETGRGGQYTYHGPGQRVGYVMLDLKKRQNPPDLRAYIYQLEDWIITALKSFDICGERREGRVGIWVDMTPYGQPKKECKIAAIGVRVRKWITFHGIAINVDPDLSHFDGIVPCGIAEHGVTSMAQLLKRDVSMFEVDTALKEAWNKNFED